MSIRITALADPDVGPSSHRLAWLASDADGVPVGTTFLRLFDLVGQDHLGELEQDPNLGGLLTDTADNNPHMTRVKDALGYTTTHATFEYQYDL